MEYINGKTKFDSKFLNLIEDYTATNTGANPGATPGATPGVGPNLTGSTPGGLAAPGAGTDPQKLAAVAAKAQKTANEKEAQLLKLNLLQTQNRLKELQKLGIK